jgi:hypothetical protein
MDSGIRRQETWTLYDEQNRPVEVTALVIKFPGTPDVTKWESGRTSDGRKLKPHAAGAYTTSDGMILTVLPTAG